MAKPKTRKEGSKDAKPATFVTVERLVADSGVTLETFQAHRTWKALAIETHSENGH